MSVIEKIKSLQPDQKFISFEFFPPKTDAGFRNLLARLNRMSALNPLFISVTWGAGGSTSEKSLDLASTCQNHLGLTTVLHLTCTNTNKEIIDNALAKAKKSGIRNILALRGDPPRSQEYWTPNCDFNSAVDLVRYIKQQYGDYFCIGVAGYAEGHVEGSGTNTVQKPEKDIPYLIEKVQAGADYIITQMFFDVDKFFKYEALLRSTPELANITLIPGLMPITTHNVFKRATKLSHASIPKAIEDRLNHFANDDDEIKSIGIDIVTEIVSQIDKKTDGRIRGYHFYCLNLEKAVASILETSDVLRPIMEGPSNAVNTEDAIDDSDDEVDDQSRIIGDKRRQSSINNDNEILTARKNIVGKALLNDKKTLVDISRGKGALGKDATWDEFPNGRFGDSTSPAYGEIDGYGPNLKIASGDEAIEKWGQPKSPKDLANVFISYLIGKVDILPWADAPLSSETGVIQEQLVQLNEKGWFTLASQPSVNGTSSSDNIFGWGPKNGIVYQKSFVEFFIPKDKWETELYPKLKHEIEDKTITFYKGDSSGNIESNLETDRGRNSKSAITWGVFPSKEVLQPTIIDYESFKFWNEEAFGLWLEWSRCFKKTEESYRFLNSIRDDYYLVSLVYHKFKNENGLWDLLLDDQ